MATLGDRLRELIRESGLDQKTFAIKMGLKVSTLNGYVNDHRTPEIELQVKIADYFNVTLDYLNGRTSSRHSSFSPRYFYGSNIDLIRHNMTYDELSRDIAVNLEFPYDANDFFPSVYLENIAKGKIIPSEPRIRLLASYAHVSPEFFYSRNSYDDYEMARASYKDEQKRRFLTHLDDAAYKFACDPENIEFLRFVMDMKKKGIGPKDITGISVKYRNENSKSIQLNNGDEQKITG